MRILRKLFKVVLNYLKAVFYPDVCISCGEAIDNGEFLCDYCRRNIERINPEKRCIKCGYEKKDCVCFSRVYSFCGIISLYENTGIAQKAYYKYKLLHKRHYASYFSKALALAIRSEYYGIEFDGICYVPSSKRSILTRGFDHSEELCREVSRITGIKFIDNLLYCKSFTRPQHKSSFDERIKNVRGKYGYRYKINAKSILLLDDIRTSGATLNECAKELLRAGADRVYCVTVLAQKRKNAKVEKQ